jgi:DNA-binding transcriptional ArsR family regulator
MNLRRDVFPAIADPTRRAILLLVASQSMTAGAIAANFETARPTVSKHLQILTECELLEQTQTGQEIYYHINAKKMKEVADFIEPFRKMWDDRFNKLESLMKKYKSKIEIIWNRRHSQSRAGRQDLMVIREFDLPLELII